MKKLFVLLCLLSVGSLASTNHRVDSHAPIGIMADHSHKKRGRYDINTNHANDDDR